MNPRPPSAQADGNFRVHPGAPRVPGPLTHGVHRWGRTSSGSLPQNCALRCAPDHAQGMEERWRKDVEARGGLCEEVSGKGKSWARL